MSGTDKIKNQAEKVRGKVKQAKGRLADDPGTEDKGRRKQVKADLKTAGEKAKDAFKH